MQWDDEKWNVFKIAKGMVQTNQDTIDEHCIRNYDGKLTIGDKEKKRVWKDYLEKL